MPTPDRSALMARIRTKNTKPELYVRSALFRSGFRYRLHPKQLPGTPDIVLPKYRVAVFVNGCFWHGHDCRAGRRPSTNVTYWEEKISANLKRDADKTRQLQELGWNVRVVWTCELERETDQLTQVLEAMRAGSAAHDTGNSSDVV